MIYPAQFTPDTGGFVVTFRDIPEAITQGDTWDEAVAMAEDALAVSMEFYFEDRRPVPAPSPVRDGDTGIALPASLAAKVLLLNAMLAQDVTPAELARRLGGAVDDVRVREKPVCDAVFHAELGAVHPKNACHRCAW